MEEKWKEIVRGSASKQLKDGIILYQYYLGISSLTQGPEELGVTYQNSSKKSVITKLLSSNKNNTYN